MTVTQQRAYHFVGLALCLGLSIWGCGDDDSSGTSCTKDTDCGDTEVCSSGSCIDPSTGGLLSNTTTGSNSTSNNTAASNATSNATTPQTCDTPSGVAEPSVYARVYTDTNASDESSYVGGFEPGTDTPMEGVKVRLFSPEGATETFTCADGQIAFGGLTEGSHVISPEFEAGATCGQRNCPRRFPEALAEGQVTIVTFGDSVPVVGDQPLFPSRLADLLAPLATIDNQNLAVGGTTSDNWLPGTSNFQNRLAPAIPDADVVMISLGGNDILAYVQGLFTGGGGPNLGDIPALIASVTEEVSRIIDNILQITDAIREINANVDIVYILYPDYSLAQNNQLWSLVNTFVGAEAVSDILVSARTNIPRDADLVLIDIFAASEGLPLDDYLVDPLHFNTLGQTLYAEEIFKGLGGILIGPSPLSGGARTPLGLETSFSVQ